MLDLVSEGAFSFEGRPYLGIHPVPWLISFEFCDRFKSYYLKSNYLYLDKRHIIIDEIKEIPESMIEFFKDKGLDVKLRFF